MLKDLSMARVAAGMGLIKRSQMALDEQGNVVYFDPQTMTLDEDGVVHPKEPMTKEVPLEAPTPPPEPVVTPPDELPAEQPEIDQETGSGLPVMIPVESSNVSKFGYDDTNQILYVAFKDKANGPDRMYAYYDVEPDVYTTFMESDSKGQFVWKYLRNRYEYARI
jgi:hypothetical protein